MAQYNTMQESVTTLAIKCVRAALDYQASADRLLDKSTVLCTLAELPHDLRRRVCLDGFISGVKN